MVEQYLLRFFLFPDMSKKVFIVLGPTGIGKTDLSIELAKAFGTEIISCDSRQIFKELSIGTAVPSKKQLLQIPHHLIQRISIRDYYNAYLFEQDAIEIANQLFQSHDEVIMVGGSGMYIDAFCNGIDLIPDIDPDLRESINEKFRCEGLEAIQQQLQQLDPEYYALVDQKNPARLIRAIEVCLQTGQTYTSIRKNTKKKRDFDIVKIGLQTNRDILYDRINRRVDKMMDDGLIEEARSVFAFRDLTALNTVGYKELFQYFDGNIDLETAVDQIKRNTRHYAKKQITWFARDVQTNWFEYDNHQSVIDFAKNFVG